MLTHIIKEGNRLNQYPYQNKCNKMWSAKFRRSGFEESLEKEVQRYLSIIETFSELTSLHIRPSSNERIVCNTLDILEKECLCVDKLDIKTIKLSIPSDLKYSYILDLPKLKHLNIENNENIEFSKRTLSNLKEIYFYRYSKELPKYMPYLKTLKFKDTKHSYLPEAPNMIHLEIRHSYNFKIKTMPEYPKIKHLECDRSNIRYLPLRLENCNYCSFTGIRQITKFTKTNIQMKSEYCFNLSIAHVNMKISDSCWVPHLPCNNYIIKKYGKGTYNKKEIQEFERLKVAHNNFYNKLLKFIRNMKFEKIKQYYTKEIKICLEDQKKCKKRYDLNEFNKHVRFTHFKCDKRGYTNKQLLLCTFNTFKLAGLTNTVIKLNEDLSDIGLYVLYSENGLKVVQEEKYVALSYLNGQKICDDIINIILSYLLKENEENEENKV